MGIAVHVYRYRSEHDQPQGVLEARAFAEQFAHVGTAISAIFKLCTYPDYIDNMRRKFMTVDVGSRLDARQRCPRTCSRNLIIISGPPDGTFPAKLVRR